MDRLVRLQGALLVALSLLGVRLVHLQLVRGAYYRSLAEQNRLRMVPEPAPRGLIVDRHDRILAANQTVFRVALVPQELDDAAAVLARVSAVVHRPLNSLEAEFRRERSFAFFPAIIVARVPKDLAVQLDEDRWRLPGLLVKAEPERSYPLGSTASQLLGYLSQPTAQELPLLKHYGVRPKELVGRMGLEKQLDHALRGRPGGLLVEVNHRGRQVRVISRRAPASGAKVVLTIDATLQSLIEQSFGSQAGAAVVLSPASGEVFAMVSVPGFPPGAFVRQDRDVIRRVLNDADAPLMNRAAVGVYPPGSIMKLVTAGAALEDRLVSPSTVIACPGSLTIGDRAFHCWYRDGHGPMTLREALMQSCNVYFMTLGRKLGAQRLLAAMDAAGFSHRTGWPMEEQPGHLPQRRFTEGDAAQMAFGQGEVLVTVLQAAVMAGALANHGSLVEPRVVRSIAGRPPRHHAGPRRLGWSPETMEAVLTGMRAVVADSSGTGHRAFSSSVSIAGKTGTAQTHVPGQTHGWFVGFCPVDQPRVALAIIAEHGGSGGDLPAQVAKGICEYAVLPAFLAVPAGLPTGQAGRQADPSR